MRAVVQRVSEASVTVENSVTGAIRQGILVLLGIHEHDEHEALEWMAKKVANLRIFQDEEQKMNLSVKDVGGNILVVSQFTLYGDAKKGMRPSFIEAARPEKAEAMYMTFVDVLRQETGMNIQTGKFGAMMQVHLINDGPVTILLER